MRKISIFVCFQTTHCVGLAPLKIKNMDCPKCNKEMVSVKVSVADVTEFLKDLFYCPVCEVMFKKEMKEIKW